MLMQRQAMASPRIHATPGGPIGNNIEIGGAGGAVVKKSGWAFFSKDPGTKKIELRFPGKAKPSELFRNDWSHVRSPKPIVIEWSKIVS